MSSCNFDRSKDRYVFAVNYKSATRCRSLHVFPGNRPSFLLCDVYKSLIHTRGKTDKYAMNWFVRFDVNELPPHDSFGLSKTFLLCGLMSSRLQPHAWKVTFCKVPVVVGRMRCFPADPTCQVSERKWEFGAACDAITRMTCTARTEKQKKEEETCSADL